MDENLLLTLLHNNARMDVTDLAMALNETEDNVVDTISQLEKELSADIIRLLIGIVQTLIM